MTDYTGEIEADGRTQLTAANWNNLVTAVNTKLDEDDVGTTAGKIFRLDSQGLVPLAFLPDGSGEGSGGGGGFTPLDSTITAAMMANWAPGTAWLRAVGEGSGPPVEATAEEWRDFLDIEEGATASASAQDVADVQTTAVDTEDEDYDADLAAQMGETAVRSMLAYFTADPTAFNAFRVLMGFVYSSAAIDENQVLIGASDGTTEVQGTETTNGTPTAAGIIAGSSSMILTADALADAFRWRQATLAAGALTFDTTTGLAWTVAAGADNIVVAESCWTGIPLYYPALLEIVAGASARTITFTNTSANLKMDTGASPWNSTSSGTRVRFEIGWAAEGAAPTVKAKRFATFLGYFP
jgi:hypothetical protein